MGEIGAAARCRQQGLGRGRGFGEPYGCELTGFVGRLKEQVLGVQGVPFTESPDLVVQHVLCERCVGEKILE